jgi:RNA polymerase sigma-70 factor, ECF subfamily
MKSSGPESSARADAEHAHSFEDFFEEHYVSVTKALVLLLGRELEAEELAEEAFARAWARWELVSEMASPAGYVYRTALNLNRNRLRRLARELRGRERPEPGPDPAVRIATRDQVRRALAALPMPQREAVVLIEWLGLDPAEAGSILGIKAVSVRARLHRARATLHKQFGGADE